MSKMSRFFGVIAVRYELRPNFRSVVSRPLRPLLYSNRNTGCHGRRSLRKSRGDKNRFPLDRKIVLKIAKNSFTVVIVDKGLCNVSAVRFYQEIINGNDRS